MKYQTLARAMLVCAILTLSISSVWAADNFTPIETPGVVTATTSSSSVNFSAGASTSAPDVKVCNTGTTLVYWACGNSSVLATVPAAGSNSTTMGAGLCGAYHKGSGTASCAAITGSGSSTVTFTSGEGN